MDSKPKQKTKFRFQIVHLLYLTAVICAAIALFESYATAWILTVLFCWIVVCCFRIPWGENPPWKDWSELAAFILWLTMFVVAVIAFLEPGIGFSMRPHERVHCRHRMADLAFSILNYETAYMNLPPAYIADDHGKPMHSWRVLVLPFLGHQDIYDSYNFDEPWDGPNNRKLVDQISPDAIFFCPGHPNHGFKTPYKFVTGPGTLFEGDKKTKLSQDQKELWGLIWIVEDNSNPVCWMQPDDLTVEEALELFDFNKSPNSPHTYRNKYVEWQNNFTNMIYSHGQTIARGFLVDPEPMRPFFTIAGEPSPELYDLDWVYPTSKSRTLYSGYFLFGFNIVLAILPAFWKRLQLFQPADGAGTAET